MSVEKERLTSEWEERLKERQESQEFKQMKVLEKTKDYVDQLEKAIEKHKNMEEEMLKIEERVIFASLILMKKWLIHDL